LGVEENSQINLSDTEGSEGEGESEDNKNPTMPRSSRGKSAVIDRTISRSSSTVSASTNFAFQSKNRIKPAGFRVPTLLHRATAGESQSSLITTTTTTTERDLGDSQGLKKGGTKSSSINYHSKAKALRGIQAVEQKKKVERANEGIARAQAGLRVWGNGSFS
jgi:hypothetical protein